MPLKTSLIRQRVADFLKSHQPFEFFSETDRLALASSGRRQLHRHSLSFSTKMPASFTSPGNIY
jgi:hypothetical protein